MNRDIILPAQNKWFGKEVIRYFIHEYGVDICVYASLFNELFKSDKVGVMSIPVFFTFSVPESIPVSGYKRYEINPDQAKALLYTLPILSVGLIMIIEIYGIRMVDLKAGLKAKVKAYMKWLGLLFQPKDKMVQVGNHFLHVLPRLTSLLLP
jgi:hypothetical protein